MPRLRIVKITKADASELFHIQYKCFWFWMNYTHDDVFSSYIETFNTYEEALKVYKLRSIKPSRVVVYGN